MSPRRLLLSLVLLGACGGGEPDPLDPDVVDDVARGEGDADGDARSGTYALRDAGTRACDCGEVQGFDLCEIDPAQLGDGTRVTITQTDGYLILAPQNGASLLSLAGSLDRDGGFDLGGIHDLSTLVGDVGLVTRLTGEFSGADRFTGLLRTRISGTVEAEDFDCLSEAEITGERLPP